jgi:uncharacterized membrane protein
MTLAPLLDASTAIQGHAFAAMATFALGVVQQNGLSCESHAKSASGPLRYVLMSVVHLSRPG